MANSNELVILDGKSANRVSKFYDNYPEDWQRQYDMLLLDGVTCNNCIHCERCCLLFGQKETDTSCQFYPSKFKQN